MTDPEPDRLYFVFRGDSALSMMAGWRDEEAALQYAEDYGAEVVLGVDVTFVRKAPFTDKSE